MCQAITFIMCSSNKLQWVPTYFMVLCIYNQPKICVLSFCCSSGSNRIRGWPEWHGQCLEYPDPALQSQCRSTSHHLAQTLAKTLHAHPKAGLCDSAWIWPLPSPAPAISHPHFPHCLQIPSSCDWLLGHFLIMFPSFQLLPRGLEFESLLSPPPIDAPAWNNTWHYFGSKEGHIWRHATLIHRHKTSKCAVSECQRQVVMPKTLGYGSGGGGHSPNWLLETSVSALLLVFSCLLVEV